MKQLTMKVILSFKFLILYWIISKVHCSGPAMTQTSMDVGNIISVVIPESPDTNINVNQLTADFRRQLEKIKKQSHVNKFEHGLITLKSALPEMSKEEKKKAIPLIRRMMQDKKNSKSTKVNNQRKGISINHRKNVVVNSRNVIYSSSKNTGYRKSSSELKNNSGTRQQLSEKYRKKFKKPTIHEDNNQQSQKIQNSDWSDVIFTEKYPSIDPIDKPIYEEKNQQYTNWFVNNTTEPMINLPPVTSVCKEANQDDSKIRNPKEINKFELEKNEKIDKIDKIESTTSRDEYDSYPSVIPINIEVDDLKGLERILQNPDEAFNFVNDTILNNHQAKNQDDNNPYTIQKNNQNIYAEMGTPIGMKNYQNYYDINHDTIRNDDLIIIRSDFPNFAQIGQQDYNDNDKYNDRIKRSIDYKKKSKYQNKKFKKNHKKSIKLKKTWKTYKQ
ncbi:hypothetical protein HCN44_001554 [Aphidius gifuensis]|uniref:Odorant-binding protein n=1 Tax=Aphidius gifuensis TaxID=684658 RepID=A0A834XW39_APHGI|nr:uncharacterized protein LOC122853251 [Aphidius gifuensis]KAF7992229.1 hypothetical protein HCN44_001554 [Aphidius gifuensis]